MGRKSYGIASTGDGSFLCATVERTASGWHVAAIRRWSADSAITNALLLSRGVVAAAPSHWRPLEPSAPAGLSGAAIAASGRGRFVPCASDATLSGFGSRLAGNLTGIVSDDAFLCTIPCALANGDLRRSFVSVFRTEQFYKIGIITDRSLAAVFTMAPAAPLALDGHLGRIRRYWHEKCSNDMFPELLCLFGDAVAPQGWSAGNVTRIDCGGMGIDITDSNALAAAGAALSAEGGDCGIVPRIPGPSVEKAAMRGVRTALYAASAAMVLVSLLLPAGLFGFSAYAHQRLDRLRREYNRILLQTPDIARLTAQNDSLARALLSAASAGSHQTRWTQFLEFLGTEKPDGLFFDMLATDASASGAAGAVRVAMSGWAYNESLVTGFISSMQNNKACSNVSLTSLEKGDARDLFTFRVVCSLQLFAGSPGK
jgi:hypothetical protein